MEHNIGQWVAKRALLNPNSEAIVDITSGRRQTYVELDASCNQVGNGLVAGGLAQGDRVACHGRLITIDPDASPLETDSAFGGLGSPNDVSSTTLGTLGRRGGRRDLRAPFVPRQCFS